jgi:hypothetical protein
MTRTALPLATLFGLVLLAAPAAASSLRPMPQDTTLHFRGVRAGARLDQLDAVLRRQGGRRLRCDSAKRDRRVSECRGTMRDSTVGLVTVWASALDSTAGIITLSAAVDSAALRRWRDDLERRYGRVAPTTQGSQTMLQWVRRRRMVRLTWRAERGELTASVSLVDGRVLDAWPAASTTGSP